MTDNQHDSEKHEEASSDLSRRDFIAMSVAAGVVPRWVRHQPPLQCPSPKLT